MQAERLKSKQKQSGEIFSIKHYLSKKLNDNAILLTSEPKNWILLDSEEFEIVRHGKLKTDSALYKKMENAGFIVTEKNMQRHLDEYRYKYLPLFEGITLHIVNTTKRCNLACPYCYANAKHPDLKKYDMDKETAEKVIDFIWQCPSNSFVIEFQGGEPLLNFPIIQHIMESVKKRKGKYIYFRMVSNLTKMDDDIAKYFANQKCVDICTSLDGPKEVHDFNRKQIGGTDSYEKVTYWIERLEKEFGFTNIGLLATITKNSLKYPKEIVDEHVKWGAGKITPNYLRMTGRAKHQWDKIGYSAEQYNDFWKEIFNYCIHLSRQGVNIKEHFSTMILQKALLNRPVCHTCSSKPCGAAMTQASYQYNGDIYTCDEGKASEYFRLGNVKTSSYREIYTSPMAMNLVNLSSGLGLLCDNCVWTNFCSFCPVVTQNSTGNIIPKLAIDFECKIKILQNHTTFERLTLSEDKPILEKWVKEPDKIAGKPKGV